MLAFLAWDGVSDERSLHWMDGILEDHSDRHGVICVHEFVSEK